jgi:hypothetical protein
MWKCGLDSHGLGKVSVAGSYGYEKEISGTIKGRNFLATWATISFDKGLCSVELYTNVIINAHVTV